MVHATFTGGGLELKRTRLREAGLWALDQPSYFSGCQPHGASSALPCQDGTAKGAAAVQSSVDDSANGVRCASGGSSVGGGSGGSAVSCSLLPRHSNANGFLAYDNGVNAAVAAAAARHEAAKGRPMAQLHRHFVAAAYQIDAFRAAWAMAR